MATTDTPLSVRHKKVKSSLFLFLAVFCCACAAGLAGPPLKTREIGKIDIRDRDFHIVWHITAPSEIEAVVGCLRRAVPVKIDQLPHGWSHKIDIDTSGRWLYDEPSGIFALLTYNLDKAYRLSIEDKIFMTKILKENSPNQAREATATAGMSPAGQPPCQP